MEDELTVDPHKYAIAKRTDLYEAIALCPDLTQEQADRLWSHIENKVLIDDGYVLRQRDWLSVGGFYGYANHVRTVAEVIEAFGDPFSQAALPELHAIANHAMSMAEGANVVERRLPTL